MKKTKKGNRFERKVWEIFRSLGCMDFPPSTPEYEERERSREVRFTVDHYDLKYDRLCRLGELLGTTNISINGEYEHGYYDGVDLCYEIVARGVDFGKEAEDGEAPNLL